MFKKNKKKNKGFTLVETLIAIAILMISVAAPLSLAAKGLEVVSLSKDHIVADFLAQEGFEWIKNKTDYNKNTHTGEAEGLINGLNECIVGSTGKCIVNGRDGYTINAVSYSGQPLKFDDNEIYQYTDGDDTKFRRFIEIKNHRNVITNFIDEISVKVTVEWDTPSGLQTYVYQSNITNW